MTGEELAAVVKILTEMGEQAQEGFKWYLGSIVLPELVGYGVGILAICMVGTLLLRIIKATQENGREERTFQGQASLLKTLREELLKNAYGNVTDDHIIHMIEEVRTLRKRLNHDR